MTQIRLPEDILKVTSSLRKSGGSWPRFSGRSTVHVACELIRESATFIEAKQRIESERHPRPGVKTR